MHQRAHFLTLLLTLSLAAQPLILCADDSSTARARKEQIITCVIGLALICAYVYIVIQPSYKRALGISNIEDSNKLWPKADCCR